VSKNSQSGQQDYGPDLDGANLERSGQAPGGGGRQPWFGPKKFGYGYGPRTWQGWLVIALLAAFLIVVGTLTKAQSPLFVVAIVVVGAVPFIIVAIQRR